MYTYISRIQASRSVRVLKSCQHMYLGRIQNSGRAQFFQARVSSNRAFRIVPGPFPRGLDSRTDPTQTSGFFRDKNGVGSEKVVGSDNLVRNPDMSGRESNPSSHPYIRNGIALPRLGIQVLGPLPKSKDSRLYLKIPIFLTYHEFFINHFFTFIDFFVFFYKTFWLFTKLHLTIFFPLPFVI